MLEMFFSRILSLHHLLGKAVFPTGWECIRGGMWVVELNTWKILLLLSSYYFLLVWPCAHSGLGEQEQSKQLLNLKNMHTHMYWRRLSKVRLGNHLCVSKLAFPELNLFVLIWPPHPWSCFQTQLFPRSSDQAHFTECHVLSFQEMDLFLEPLNTEPSLTRNVSNV